MRLERSNGQVRMRIGIAGVGRIGTMHASHLAALPRVDEVLLFDPVAGRAATVAGTVDGARAVARIDDLLADCAGVLVATPTDTHAATVRRCLAADVPVLCEKPIAKDLAEMTALIDEIDAASVPVLVGFQRRFDPALVELRRRIETGELGVIYQVRSVGIDANPPDFGYLPTSGGIFRDLFIHDLDAVPWLVGEPVVEVYATGSVLVDEAFAAADDVDNAMVLLTFAGGAQAVLAGGRHDPLGYDHRIEVLASRDSVAVGLDPRTPLNSIGAGGPAAAADAYDGFQIRFRAAYLNEMAVFVDVVAGRVDNPSPARDSLVSLRLAEACERSRRTGAVVRMDGPARKG
jgi:myo-inositol 2-dehydrogenase / D-chiro-inositol 1-dehydrogenase